MEDIMDRLRRVSATYKMYADSSMRNATEFKLRSKHKHKIDPYYTKQNADNDLLLSKEFETNSVAYWSFHNEIELMLKDYDQPIDFII